MCFIKHECILAVSLCKRHVGNMTAESFNEGTLQPVRTKLRLSRAHTEYLLRGAKHIQVHKCEHTRMNTI